MPSTPMKDDRLGDGRILEDHAGQRLLPFGHGARMKSIAAASEMPRITPVSCTGKKPLGITMYKQDGDAQRRLPPPPASPADDSAPISTSCHSAAMVRSNSALCTLGKTHPVRSRGLCRSSRAHIIGVKVNETTAEIRIVMLSVTANSRNSRPTTSPMNSSGISTAISEMVSDRMVNAICCGAFERGLQRRIALLDVPGDVLDHHDRIVHDETRRDRQRHQRQIVEAEPHQVHGAERPDQRQRNGRGGNDGRGQRPQKQKDHHDHQRHREHQFELHVTNRRANGRRAVGQHGHVDGGRQGALQLRQATS